MTLVNVEHLKKMGMVFGGCHRCGNDKDRQESVSRLAAPFVWTAFEIMDELKKEGKIK